MNIFRYALVAMCTTPIILGQSLILNYFLDSNKKEQNILQYYEPVLDRLFIAHFAMFFLIFFLQFLPSNPDRNR